jgi:hypothetical protein
VFEGKGVEVEMWADVGCKTSVMWQSWHREKEIADEEGRGKKP